MQRAADENLLRHPAVISAGRLESGSGFAQGPCVPAHNYEHHTERHSLGPYEILIPLGIFLILVGAIAASAGEGRDSANTARFASRAGMIGVSAGMLLTTAGFLLSATP